MRSNKWGYGTLILLLLTLIGVSSASTVMATNSSSSPNFEISEAEFGAGAALESCSGSYCAKATIGSLSDEPGRSASGSAEFGPIATDSEPMLEVIVEPGESNLGVLETDKTASKITIVRVRSYMSGGYTMLIMGEPPAYDGYRLNHLTTPTASSPGTEQFGINVVANTTPEIGADPVQIPSDQMSFGEVYPNYAIPNRFTYNSGDPIAESQTESGRTDYTISMIINVSSRTPAGHYTSDFSAIVVPIF